MCISTLDNIKQKSVMKKFQFCALVMLLSCVQFLFAADTPVKTWRENMAYGFAINEQFSDGTIRCTTYSRCQSCYGSGVCGMCGGSGACSFCYGRGMIYSVGYSYPCQMCQRTGRCNMCGGSRKCFCTRNNPYPGYTPHSIYWFSADGQLIFSDRGSDWNGGGSSSSRSSSSGSKVCPVCHGRKYSSQAYSYAAGSAAGWMPPYHHGGGSGCPYCNSRSDHYHYPCNECHGTGHK